nr:MAG TPA: hypothetical protein [Caudoviricetes sp.]DAZ78566.1 MAG TPA: hypothetical protein [Caudoviricetes sp.]
MPNKHLQIMFLFITTIFIFYILIQSFRIQFAEHFLVDNHL